MAIEACVALSHNTNFRPTSLAIRVWAFAEQRKKLKATGGPTFQQKQHEFMKAFHSLP